MVFALLLGLQLFVLLLIGTVLGNNQEFYHSWIVLIEW